MTQLYERAWKSIITPAKFTHNLSSFCPKIQKINGKLLQRIDFNIRNDNGKYVSAVILKCQEVEPQHTIFYFHGNGGSKLQCLGFVPFICQNNIAVIGFDFIGCGNSDNGYLTYGVNEAKDAQQVLREADKYYKRTKLTIWGRSMGAITAIKFAQKNGKIIQNLVLDSPFKNLGDTVKRVMKKETNLPQSLASVVLYFLRRQIEKKVGFNLFEINNFKIFQKIQKEVHILFFYSQADQIVSKEQILEFYTSFKGQKQLIQIFQHHQEQRSECVYEQGIQWVKRGKSKRRGKLKLKLAHMCGDFELQKNYVKNTGFCCNNTICYK